MTTNTDVTIVGKIFDENTRTDRYITTYIKNASWYADFKATFGEKALKSGDVYKVRIPIDGSTTDLQISKGDYVIKGNVVINKTDTPKTFLKDKEAFTITSYSKNDRGCLKHYRIFGT